MIPLTQRLSTEIRILIESLNESNSDAVLRELSQYVDYGMEGSILLLETCFDHFNVYERDLKSTRLEPVVASLFRKLLEKPQFSTVFSVSVRPTTITEEFLDNLSVALHLSAYEKLGFGLALTDSENNDIRMAGRNFCIGQIEELCAAQTSLHTTDYVQDVLLFLKKSEVLSKHVDSFMQLLSLVQFDKDSDFVLAPFLSDELQDSKLLRNMDLLSEVNENEFDAILAEMEREMNMADMMKELGYKCTLDVTLCKDLLSSFSPLTEVTVAKILGTVIRSDTGFQDHENAFLTFCSALGRGSLSDMPSSNSWNTDVLIESIKQLAPGISWNTVMENLDHEGFYISDEATFSLLISCYRRASQDPFPLAAVCGSVWRNTEGQLSFLKHAVSVPPEVFTFAHCPRQLSNVDAVNSYKFQSGHANHAWLCLDLLEVLCHLAERGLAKSVRSLLEYPLKNCPEVLLFGMAHVNTPYNLLQHEVSSVVLPVILKDASASGILLSLWHVNPPFLLRALTDALNIDADNMNRVLDLCQELKIVSPVLDMVPMSLGIRLAALASRKELIDLEKWLSSNLHTYKDTFFEECLRFLNEVESGAHESSSRLHNSSNISSLYTETTSVFLKVLDSHTSLLSSNQLSREMEALQLRSTNNNSRMNNSGRSDSSTSEVYADDIETEANSYFHKIFSGQLTVDAMIQMLTQFKESPDQREQSIFECMIANLFEEYKFFNRYPDRQLKLAAVLIGLLIKNQLVIHLTLGIALRAVLDALRKPADSKMFVFGTTALDKFLGRLIEWPQYCQHILQISHLRGTHSDLVAFIERELAKISSGHPESDSSHNPVADQHHNSMSQSNMEVAAPSIPLTGSSGPQLGSQISSPIQLQQRNHSYLDERHRASVTSANYMKPNLPTTGQVSAAVANDPVNIPKPPQGAVSSSAALASSPAFVRPSRTVTSARFGSALNIETLVAAADRREVPIEAPPSDAQDKISFIINNLSSANIESKAKEFTDILKEEYYPWFAQYMVMKRASIEPNFHDLYLKFLEKANSKALTAEFVKATYENCKVLLGSELIKSSSEERSLLKNLGGWLGKITIGRNHVLRAREIDPKALIIEAYEKGLMIAVIPFTSKILESCSNSLAYQPPNPWTMGVLALLAEIYAMPNLKMNLRFEIEVLFKNLNVDLKEVIPSSLLVDRVREVEGNPDFSNKDIGSAQQPMVGEVKSNIISSLNQVELPVEVGSSSHPGGHSRILNQYAAPHHLPAAPHHLPAATLSEDEKMAALGLSDKLPSAQGLLQAQLPFPVGQIPSSNMDQQVIINPKLQTLGLHLHFQSVLGLSMEMAIKEIVSSIVQRSVSIATQTTKELVLKDYAMEADESRIHSAAHLMVASLAGSLAHVTCKEPLRGSISSQLRNNLQALNLNIASELLEHAVQLVTNDNLDLGCALIEQAATEKALQTIDSELAPQLSIRRKHREGVGPAFFDTSLYTKGHVGVLPEALRPKPGRLSHSQQRVYEDFVRLPWQNQSNQNSNAIPLGPSAPQGSSALHRGYSSVSNHMNPAIFTSAINAVAHQSLDSEDMESSSVKLLSGSSVHSTMGGGIGPHNFENETGLSSFSSVSAPELHIPESSSGSKELGVYAQTLPSPSASDHIISTTATEPSLTPGDACQIILEKLQSLIVNDAKEAEVQSVISEVPGVILRCISRDEAALAVAQKVFKGLYENAANTAHVGAHLALLAAIRDVSKLVFKQLTSWVIYSDEDRKFNKDITIGLICRDLLNLAEYNVHMAKLLDAGKNKVATEFAISLIQTLVSTDARVLSELHNLVDALAKLATRPDAPEALQQLVEIARNPTASSSGLPAGKDDLIRQQKDKKVANQPAASREDSNVPESSEPDPAGFHEQVSQLFAEWYRIYELPGVNDQLSARFVLQLQQLGLLKADDTSDRFFRRLLDIAVSHCISSEGAVQSHQQTQTLSFLAIDMYTSLVFSILKFSSVDHGLSKLSLLSKVLTVTVRFIQKDAEEKKTSFNPRPYFRLFIDWLLDLNTLDPVFEGANFQVLTALATSFHALQPLKVPAFSFVWLELVSHRSFMPKLLNGNAQKGWLYFQRLLVDLFQFMEPFLRNAELGEPVRFLYKGSLRVLLVLLHDFPEFLCDYHFSFCDIIPPSCIQMRNIVLSAFPRNMRLPDPSTPNLKIDLLAEISQSPRILSEVDAALKAKQMKSDVDEYLKTRQQGTSFLSELKQKLILSPTEAARAGTRYNVPLMNSLVLYVGMQAIQQLQARTPHGQSMASNTAIYFVGAALDIFQTLILELETEGRYLFLNAVANQLRYPNNHTHYFSFILLYLFSESNQEAIQEQITRVLLERLIVNRPHPWGLLITFIELIKNPRYNFWSRSFTRCAPEIEKLFESVSRSCGGPKPVDDNVVAGGISDTMH